MSIGASELIAADFGRPTTAFERSWRGPNERTPRCSSFSGHCISVPAGRPLWGVRGRQRRNEVEEAEGRFSSPPRQRRLN